MQGLIEETAVRHKFFSSMKFCLELFCYLETAQCNGSVFFFVKFIMIIQFAIKNEVLWDVKEKTHYVKWIETWNDYFCTENDPII